MLTGISRIFPSASFCAKYLLMCPMIVPLGGSWMSFKDFKDAAPLIQAFFNTVSVPIAESFSNRLADLERAAKDIGGYQPADNYPYDLSLQFDALSKIPLLLLFNDKDDEFPAQCSVLFEKRVEKFLDMECLAMVGMLFSDYLRKELSKKEQNLVRLSKMLRWILYILGGLIVGIILILAIVLVFVPITVDLSEYKGPVESAASLALGRTVKVDDKIVIATSLQPYFSLEGLRISEIQQDFQTGDFLQMKKARIGVQVLPLLSGKVHITGNQGQSGLSVLLVENEKGAVNWSFSSAAAPESKAPAESKPQPEERDLKLESDSLVVADLLLEDISVDYRNPGLKEPLQFKIEECKGSMTPGKPLSSL